MEHLIVHEYRIPIKGVKQKILYHFSDVHLSLDDALSTPEERERAQQKTQSWREERMQFARHHGEACGEEHQLEATEHLEHLLAAAEADGDALVIAGDLFDYVSPANVRAFEQRFSRLSVPYVYVCGNHEPRRAIPDESAMAVIKQPVQTLDLGDMLLVGFDDSERAITDHQLDALRDLLAQDKPLILAMHIPIQIEQNPDHKACDDYFRLNHQGAPAQNLAFIELIRQNPDKIAAVLTGHLHFLNRCELAPGLTQYVSSQGVLGNLNRYVIGE